MRELNVLQRAVERTEIVASAEEYRQLLDTLSQGAPGTALVVDFLNQHAANLLMSDAAFRADFLAANVILRDGIGMRLAMAVLRRRSGMNMNGTDFIPPLIRHFSRRHPQAPILVFGTREPWLTRGARRLLGAHAGPLLLRDGFQEAAHYCAAAQQHAQAMKLIVLAMGMPRQEQIAQRLQRAPIGPALIVCGGAIVDFAAARVARAPAWMRACGLEWLYRLALEPKRLCKRYVIGIPVFLSRVLLSKWQMRAR